MILYGWGDEFILLGLNSIAALFTVEHLILQCACWARLSTNSMQPQLYVCHQIIRLLQHYSDGSVCLLWNFGSKLKYCTVQLFVSIQSKSVYMR
jgi:hypothetical protein